MSNASFTFSIEGDSPWSHRLTEVVNAGTLPIIIKHRWNPLPFLGAVDYTEFALFVEVS